MTKELMQLEVDSDLKKAFLACVSRAYNGKVEQGILDLMRIYVERAQGTPGQKMIKEKEMRVNFRTALVFVCLLIFFRLIQTAGCLINHRNVNAVFRKFFHDVVHCLIKLRVGIRALP